ncbi:MAG: flagellar assembly protein T N-terminal domain-containing protein [Myxococcales bacterium]|nr:flagellar assembly protein T N-terminal domain-containing protein [Myxococcales bacterium]
MLRSLAIVATIAAAMPAFAQSKGEIDWNRRVLIGHGQGAPDLNAPSVAVARLGAERAAKVDAYRNALETLKGMQVQSGGSVGTLLQNDATLTSRVDGELKGVRPIKTHYYSDGGVSLDIEVPLDDLPAELARAIKVPEGVAPLKGAGQAAGAGGQGQQQAAGGDTLAQVAQGQAAVLNGDKPAAREKAIQDALRHAVEMAVGTKVTSQNEIQDFQSKMDQVFTHSAGFVKRYEILKEGMDGDVVQVTIRAIISNADLDKDLEAMGMLMARKGMPRTMVLIAEQNIGMAAPAAAWMKDKGGQNALVSADLRIAETTILDQLKNGGFRQLIDPEIATEKAAQVGGITTEITASQARKLKSLTGAEVILIGRVIATSRGEMGDLGPGWRSCTATISGRAVNTDNGDILSTDETTQNAAQLDDLTCGKEAIKKASKVFSQDMIKKIAARWSQDVSGGNEIHVTVHKVAGYKQANELKSALTAHVRGVKGVSQRSFSGGTQELDVTLVGSTDQFAQEVEAKKLGKFSVKVTGVTANTVDLELGQ